MPASKSPSLSAKSLVLIILWLLAVGFLAALAEGIIPKTLWQVLLVLFLVGPLLLFGEAILEAIAHIAGRLLLPVLTLGLCRAESAGDELRYPWYGVARSSDGKYTFSIDLTSLFGLVVLVFIVSTAVLFFYWNPFDTATP